MSATRRRCTSGRAAPRRSSASPRRSTTRSARTSCSSPCFAAWTEHHPTHVAVWLGEVFGGPPRYTEQHGGYPHMLGKHRGRALTEKMRRRWVS